LSERKEPSVGILIILVSLWLLVRNNIKEMFYFFILLVVSIPNNDNIKIWLKIILYNFDLTYVPLLLSFLIVSVSLLTKKMRVKILKKDIPLLILFVLIITYIFVGMNYKNQFLISDLKIYITLIFVFVTAKCLIKTKNDFYRTLKLICVGSLVYSLAVVYIYYFEMDKLYFIYGEMLQSWWGNRVTFGNTSLLIITLGLSLYFYSHNKWLYSCIIIFNVYAIYLSQNRTVILMCILSVVIFNLVRIIQSANIKILSRKIFMTMLLIIMASIFMFIFVKNESNIETNELIQRFYTQNDTLLVRNTSNEMAFNSLITNPLGQGIGKELILYNVDMSIANIGIFIDNIFATLGVKLGILGISVFCYILLSLQISLYRIYMINRKEKLYLLLFILHPPFLVITAYMNAQIIYSLPVMVFYFSTIAFLNKLGKRID
jgi:hypothetical protein